MTKHHVIPGLNQNVIPGLNQNVIPGLTGNLKIRMDNGLIQRI